MFVLMSLDRRYVTVGWREKDKKPVLFRTRDGHFIGINPDYGVKIRGRRWTEVEPGILKTSGTNETRS
jgi:hypothetical protein